MDNKFASKSEFELQKVENRPSPRSAFTASHGSAGTEYPASGYFRDRPFTTNSPRFQPSTITESFYNSPSTYSPSQRNVSSPCKPVRCLEVCVFFMNKLGVNLELEDGHIATVDEITHILLSEEEVGLPPDAATVFSLWMTSPHLEVQLKPHHIPYKIRQQWPELLKKYTTADPDKAYIDEPLLCFQRNVFYPKKDEIKLQDKSIIELLYEEAKVNILEGRYPCEEANYYMLAGLQARIQLGQYNPDNHTLDYFRTRLKEYLPELIRGSKWSSVFRWSFNAKNGPESRILEHFRNIPSDSQPENLKKKYLEFCWTLPYYGGAFFQGQVEKPVRGITTLVGSPDQEVLVSVNSSGVYVINQDENVVLLGLKYEEFCWEFVKPKQPDNPDCFSCVYLQFQITENDKKLLKILQIFSKQAAMMDALITVFVDELKQRQSTWDSSQNDTCHSNLFTAIVDVDEIDIAATHSTSNHFSDALVPLTKATISRRPSAESCIANKLNRLSLATFNEEGECIGQMGSLTFAR